MDYTNRRMAMSDNGRGRIRKSREAVLANLQEQLFSTESVPVACPRCHERDLYVGLPEQVGGMRLFPIFCWNCGVRFVSFAVFGP